MAYKNPADKRARGMVYYAANREKVLAKQAERKEEKALYDAVYYRAHKDKKRAYDAAYYVAHKEESSAYCKAYNSSHKEELAAYHAVYRDNHGPERAAHETIRRALIAGTLIGITAAQKAQIDEIYRKAKEDPKVRCYLCDKLIPLGDRQVDHIFPVIKGGASTPSNLAIACQKCNRSKSSKHPNELGMLI